MGQSTNAILFYGYCWDEETRQPWNIGKDYDETKNDDEEWEERYARLRGVTAPAVAYPNRRGKDGYSMPKDEEYTPAELAAKNEHRAHWDAKRSLVEASGVEIDTHCSGECPMPFVSIRASKTVSYRGSMSEITSLAVDPSWDVKLREFCELMGIKTDGMKATWWLVSDWN